jgi:hypothetical protein
MHQLCARAKERLMAADKFELTQKDLEARLARPKSPLVFAESLLDTALRVTLEKWDGRLQELDAKVQVFNCGHMVPNTPPEEGEPLGGCTAVSITIEGVTHVYCKCVGISADAY